MGKRSLYVFGILTVMFAFVYTEPLLARTAKLHVDVGLNHFYKNRYLEAFREFKAALEKDPRYPDAHYNLGRVYKAQGFLKEALIQFQTALQLKPDYHAARREIEALNSALAVDIKAQQKIEGSQTFKQTAFDEMSPADAEKRARELLNQGRPDEAIRYFEVALRGQPENINLNKITGFLLFRQNRFSESLDKYNKALASAPADSEIFYAIGLIYMKMQLPQKAESSFSNAVRLQPEMLKAVFGLGESLEAQERYEDAIFQFRRCLELNPGLKEAENKLQFLAGRQSYNYFSRGSYFYQRGDYEQAEPLLSLARNYGSLTDDQNKQVDEMLNASRFWIEKKREQDKVEQQRRQIRGDAYVSKNIEVQDVSQNPGPYIGKAVEWIGKVQFVRTSKNRKILFVNSQSSVNFDANMDYAYEVVFPKELPDDARIGLGSSIKVKGRITKVSKLLNINTNSYSSRRQPVVEASEISFTRTNYDQPLVLRFY